MLIIAINNALHFAWIDNAERALMLFTIPFSDI